MEGWAEFVDEMKQYYGVSMECLSGAEPGGPCFGVWCLCSWPDAGAC